MPPLLDLSNELLYKIVDHIHPDDILNFSLCRKEIYLLAKDAVSLHVQRKRIYENILLHGCHRHEHNHHPLQLLRDICMDWRVGEYPKNLTIECCHHPNNVGICVEDIDEEDIAEFKSEKGWDDVICQTTMRAIQGYIEENAAELGFPILNHAHRGPYYDNDYHFDRFNVRLSCMQAEKGDRDAMLALLLLFVPNLERICLARSTWDAECLESAIDWVAFQKLKQNPRARKLLMNLSRVRFLGYDDPDMLYADGQGENFERFMSFAALPSMRTMFGDFVEGIHDGEWKWEFPPHTSNVTEIILHHSAVKAQFLSNLLVGIQALKRFTYDHNIELSGGRGMKPHEILPALLEHARHSLEYLHVTGDCEFGDEDSVTYNRCLQGFEVLKEVYLGCTVYAGFYCEGPPDIISSRQNFLPLVYILPPSIETVSIHGYRVLRHATELLADLAGEKQLRVPKLNKIFFVDSDDWEWDDGVCAPAMKRMCEKVGVKLETYFDNGLHSISTIGDVSTLAAFFPGAEIGGRCCCRGLTQRFHLPLLNGSQHHAQKPRSGCSPLFNIQGGARSIRACDSSVSI